MASLDTFRNFIKNRLAAYDPSIDVSDGATATTEVVDPIVARLGTQPFDLDTKVFIKQRITETYPNSFTAGEIEDLFINPLLTIIDPLLQEEIRIGIGQSLNNINLMADEEVDDLIANSFEERAVGGFASGFIRCYYATPVNLIITTDKPAISKSGLNFFSPENIETSSADMLLNREGFSYFLDILVTAEKTGEAYNIEPDGIASFPDMKNPIKVTNLFKFTGGLSTESNDQLVQKAKDGRIEQSLNTKRGASARIKDLFPSIKSLQTIGAGEDGMNRDILDGSSDGPCYMTFLAGLFGTWLLLDTTNSFLDPAIPIEVGDKIKFQVATGGTVYQTTVVGVLFTSPGPPVRYFIEVADDFSTPALYGHELAGLLFKPGYITISHVPEGALSGTIPTNQVHIGGFMDIYVAPTDDVTAQVTIKNIADQIAFFKTITGQTTINDNAFSTNPVTDFVDAGISVGDSLILETGGSVGVYTILFVDTTLLRVDALFTATNTNIRARIVKNVTIDYLEPKTPKIPFLSPTSDLTVAVGSTLFTTVLNLIGFGVVVGDIIEILLGPNKGRYTITAFDTGLGGNGPIVNFPAVFSQTNVPYKVYSIQTGMEVPIVRVERIDLLDSSNQPTGFTVPYGDLVDVRAKCDFEVEGTPETVLEKKLFFIPDFFGVVPISPDPATPAPGVDARYTQDIASHDGIIRKVLCSGGNPITIVEINIPPFLYDHKKNSVMALVNKKDLKFTADPSGNAQTSALAETSIESILSVLSGPNVASYMIKDLRILDLWGVSGNGHYAIAIAQIDGQFRTDPGNNVLAVIDGGIFRGSGLAPTTFADYLKIFQYATDWTHSGSFIEAVLIPKFRATMAFFGFTLSIQECRDFINSVVMSSYTVGKAPRGELRCYTKEPVTVELYTEAISTYENPIESVTTFDELLPTGSSIPAKKVRVIPGFGLGQIFPQAKEELTVAQYSRGGSLQYPADTYYYLTSPPSFLKHGVQDGDTLEYYTAINDYSSRGVQASSFLCCTTAGSDIVQLIYPTARNNLTALSADQILCIDSGPDVGVYTIIEVVTDADPVYKVRLSRALSHTTLVYPTSVVFTGTCVAATNNINDINIPAIVTAGQYISIYAATSTGILTTGNDAAYLGTFKILGLGIGFAVLDRTANFPANANILWIPHIAPTTPPTPTSNGGTELSTQYVRARLYSNTKSTQKILIDWTVTPNPIDSTSTQQIQLPTTVTTLGSTMNFSHKMPFRVVRKGLEIISSTDMSKQREQGLYYFDVPVLSLGTAKDYLFNKNDPFYITGSFKIEGYLLNPGNKILSYSTQEAGTLKLPLGILPVGSDYSKDNYLSIAGSTLKITYDQAPTVRNVQEFVSSPLDRVANTNTLVRHFLPAYPYIEVAYVGGADTDLVGQDIISYINTLLIEENEIRVDALIDLLKKRLARQVKNPIQLVALVHGENRRIRTLRSSDSIGILSDPIYDGRPKMIAFYPGPDVSKDTEVPNLEYVKLTRS